MKSMHYYAHQQKIIDEDPAHTGLFLGTGSGKTRVALALARGKTLVICPKTQRDDGNWQREKEKMNLAIDLIVTSKEDFRRDWAEMAPFNTVIVDECHTLLGVSPTIRYRNRKPMPKASQVFDALDAYLYKTEPDRVYLCTATIIRSPMTVWGAYRILRPRARGASFEGFLAFRNKYYTKLPIPGREVWVPKSSEQAKEDLGALVRKLGYTGRLEDFFDVPEQSFKTDYIELTTEQKARLKEIPLEYPDPLVLTGKRHQIENGVLAGDEYTAPLSFANGKVDRILDYALEFPRMVIFARYRGQIDAIASALQKEGYKVLTMTGDTKERGEVIKEANESAACILIVSAQISAGWELPTFPVMIFASRTYSFVDYDQSLGRIQRANNIKKNLYIFLIVRGGVDEAVGKALANKQDFNEAIYETQGG